MGINADCKHDFAYDFFEGDLVAPYGNGVVADVVFRVETQNVAQGHEGWYTNTIVTGDVRFPDNNGIQVFFMDNRFRDNNANLWPFHAPETGYHATLAEAVENGKLLPKGKWDTIERYFIKVRGTNVHQGCYGMIASEIAFSAFINTNTTSSIVQFTYYLNPDQTTNLEYNHTNLLKRLGYWDRGAYNYPRLR